jgi:hypothetical protein
MIKTINIIQLMALVMIVASCMEETGAEFLVDSTVLVSVCDSTQEPLRAQEYSNLIKAESLAFACPQCQVLTSSRLAQFSRLPNAASPVFLLIYQNGQLNSIETRFGTQHREHLCTRRLILQSSER